MSNPENKESFCLNFNVGAVRDHLGGVLRDYRGWILKNPRSASDVESFFKILAYLLPGKIRGNTTVLPELLYSTANVISFWHDHVLRQEQELIAEQARAERVLPRDNRNGTLPGAGPSSSPTQSSDTRRNEVFRIQVALTILEYFEVFLEVAAKKLWGDAGRWVIIFVMQAVKACLRAVLVFYYKIGLVRSPIVPPFDRVKFQLQRGAPLDTAFVLKHSGRVIRKLQASPQLHARDWDVPELPFCYSVKRELPKERLIAEIIHIARPLCHLISLGACGTASFKPWLISLLMDVSSLYLHGDPLKCNKRDDQELQKRMFSLFFYLVRSPFYDRVTKARLITALQTVGSRIPVVGNLLLLIAQAIPQWQATYSYVWS